MDISPPPSVECRTVSRVFWHILDDLDACCRHIYSLHASVFNLGAPVRKK